MTVLTRDVVNSLNIVAKSFQLNELAYLALTQKVEHAIRDKLAFSLYQELRRDPTLLVCREWRRSDLAIVQKSKPRLILEAKAIYSFDIVKTGAPHPFPSLVARDLEKAAQWTQDAPPDHPLETLALVIATHPHATPNEEYKQAVKYYGGVAKYAIESNTFLEAGRIMETKMPNLDLVYSESIPAGEAFGVQVSVFYWLYSPKRNPTV